MRIELGPTKMRDIVSKDFKRNTNGTAVLHIRTADDEWRGIIYFNRDDMRALDKSRTRRIN